MLEQIQQIIGNEPLTGRFALEVELQYSDSNFAQRNNFLYRKSRNLCEKFESDDCIQ